MDEDDREAVSIMDIDMFGTDPTLVGYVPPPGEEGFDLSHAGGEFDAIQTLAREIRSTEN